MINRLGICLSACAAAIAFTNASVMAGSHSWKINEIFSTADGNIQFIEFKECCGFNNEVNLALLILTSNANVFGFGSNLPCANCTAGQHMLVATDSYVALGVGPSPDYTVPDGFFSVAGDTITYNTGPPTYDDFTFGGLMLPTDGVNSLNRDLTTGVNSPTNLNGETGPLNVPCNLADISANGVVDVPDLLTLLAAWGMAAVGPPDLSGNGIVDVPDLLALLAQWGPC